MRAQKFGKVFAVISALVLGGSFVGYRYMEQAKVAQVPEESSSLPVMLPSSKNPSSDIMLPSSKSIAMPVFRPSDRRTSAENDFILPLPPVEEAPEKEVQRPLLPGSKIGGILRPEDAKAIDRDEIESIIKDRKIEPAEDAPPP
jgi:hypothetical protein